MNGQSLSQQITTDAAPRSVLLNQVITFLERSGIRYCVVGDSRPLPEEIDGDVDIVVEQSEIDALPGRLSEFCRSRDFQLVQVIQHESTAYFCVVASQDSNGRVHFLQADICGDYYRNGKPFLAAEELLTNRTAAVDQAGREKGFYVPEPAAEFIYYLLKKVDKQRLTEAQAHHLSRQWQQDPSGARRNIQRFWPPRFQSIIEHAGANNSWKTFRHLLPELREALHDGWSASIHARRREAQRLLRRITEPAGLFLSVLGPDGSGKSSVASRVLDDLAGAFWDTDYVHLRPKLGIAGADEDHEPVTAPHGQAPRSAPTSILKSLYYLADYNLGYAWDIRPKLVRSTLIVFDRYFHDMLVDPARYRYGGPERVTDWFSDLLPRPDLFVFLDAPAEVLHDRKQEVSLDETKRQRREYRRLAEKLDNTCIIDASQPLNAVAADVERHVVDFMARRTANRFPAQMQRYD